MLERSVKHLLFLIRSAPYTSLRGAEGVEAALAASVFDQQIALLWMDDGVYQLLNDQQGEALSRQPVAKMVPALHLYDIDHIFVCARSMTERGLVPDDLVVPDDNRSFKLLATAEISDLIQAQDQVLSF